MGPAIEAIALRRTYRRRRQEPKVALDGLSLTVEPNEIHGLLGPNGAGKSTLVKILSTILLPSGGTARVLGHDVVAETDAVRALIGVVLGGDLGLYNRISARRNLHFFGTLPVIALSSYCYGALLAGVAVRVQGVEWLVLNLAYGLEALVGLAWFTGAVCSLDRLVTAGRRTGTLST